MIFAIAFGYQPFHANDGAAISSHFEILV